MAPIFRLIVINLTVIVLAKVILDYVTINKRIFNSIAHISPQISSISNGTAHISPQISSLRVPTWNKTTINTTLHQIGVPSKLPILVIAACAHSLKSWKSLNETSLQTLLIPSIERTVKKKEIEKWDVRLYLGIDHDDKFWLEHHKKLVKPEWLTMHWGFYKSPQQKVPFNQMMQHAYNDGAEYMVRINDDTEFLTTGWITYGVNALQTFYPPNVGVVGPTCHQGNTEIMTHDMVHRTHLDIFENYYPTVFSAWWIDDWITLVYKPSCSKQLPEWEVKHHTNMHGTRYTVQGHEKNFWKRRWLRGRNELSCVCCGTSRTKQV